MKHDIYKKIIKQKIIILFSFLFILTISLTTIIFLMNYNNKNQYILIDVLSRQRMLTQKMTKDAYNKYEIIESIGFNDQIYNINQSLDQSKKDFKTTLTSLETGVLYYKNSTLHFENSVYQMEPLIENTFLEWDNFSKSIDIIINSEQIDEQYITALHYISDNNEQLLEYSDEITQSLITYQKEQTNKYILIAIISFIISLCLLIEAILQLHKYIISPLNELYKGISELCFLDKSQKLSLPTKKEIIPVIDDINNGFNKLNNLIELIKKISEETSFDGTLNYIYTSFSQFIPYSHIGIALLRDNGDTIEASYGISDPTIEDKFHDLLGLKANLKSTSLGNIINKGDIRVINDLEDYSKNKVSNYNQIIKSAGIKSSITLPLKINNKPVGVIFFSSIDKNIYTKQHISFLETLSSSIAISFSKNIFIDELIYSTILALAKMAESRDEETGDHLDRMKNYAVKITEFLQQDNLFTKTINLSFIKNIEKFSPMHDIGKVGIRDGILLKPGKLTYEEFEEMKKHTIYGAEVLRAAENNIAKNNISIFKFGIEIVESHHEKWDGSGYPNSKKGEEIPLSARIVAVADVLDALTSKRPYKVPFSFEESFNMIIEGKGKHFDPIIIESFISHKEDIYKLYKSFNLN
ncbi:MAG: metal dependent phosphohydrolase [Haloplasmataceae bacterium]|jgi:HD-GYP domain-containing protein (c-di-GMP phosphodiesterase class II)|nr:metal dependent phosphohydrolase [Haloplasmataceae bacterium]